VRKQFIRERQWNHEIFHLAQRLRRELQQKESEWGSELSKGEASAEEIPETVRVERPLRCFMLPGEELLDIRCLWEKLQSEGCYLRFLGFNSGMGSEEKRREMAVNESAVTQLAKVCKDSHVAADTFQDIARKNTQAYRLFRQYGPYDVVNLDMCDSLVPRGVGDETTANYSALHGVLVHQLEHQKSSWLLFATTQVDRASANQAEINRLADSTRHNCDEHIEFAQALGELIPDAAFRGTAHAFDISHLDGSALVRVFGVVLGKWLMDALGSASPRCSVKLLSSYRYVIRQDMGVEMLSLGFLITPHYAPPVDQTGTSALQLDPRPFPSELQTGLSFVEVAHRIRDVDDVLRNDPTLREELAHTQADMLAAAGYDREAYLRWVAEGEQEGGS
jgi:hypothetical protein